MHLLMYSDLKYFFSFSPITFFVHEYIVSFGPKPFFVHEYMHTLMYSDLNTYVQLCIQT